MLLVLSRGAEVGARDVFVVGLGVLLLLSLLLLVLLWLLLLCLRLIVLWVCVVVRGATVLPVGLLGAAACAAVVNERVLQRPLWRLVELVMELCLRVGVSKLGLVRRRGVSAEWQGRCVPYLGRALKGGRWAGAVPRRLLSGLLLLLRSGQEVPGQRLRLARDVLARESASHVLDRVDSRRSPRLLVHRLLRGRRGARLLVLLLLLGILLVGGLLRLLLLRLLLIRRLRLGHPRRLRLMVRLG